MRKSQMVVLCGSLAGVAATGAGGWVAGTHIESPAEMAARTAPPTPSPILVPIEERVLSTNIVTRGTARYGVPQPIGVAPSVLKSNAVGLITTLPSRNAHFNEGDVLFTISGRPVIVAEGKIPAYRDFIPGISGTDVRQLEHALKNLGFDPGPVDGTYDDKTGSAVKKWYTSAGFEPFGPTSEQLANVQSLELALAEGKKNKMLADSALAVADLALASAHSKARHAEQAATAELQAALSEGARPNSLPFITEPLASSTIKMDAESGSAQDAAGLTPIRNPARSPGANGHGSIDKKTELPATPNDLQTVTPPNGETLTSRVASQQSVAYQPNVNLNNGDQGLQSSSATDALTEGNAASERRPSLNANVTGQPRETVDAKVEAARAALRAAQTEGELAIFTAAEAKSIAAFDVRQAADRLDKLATELEGAKRKLGYQLPLDEIVFIPALPVRVQEVTAVVGNAASGPVMSVTDNKITIHSSLSLEAAPLIKPGMEVLIDEPAVGIKTKGIVELVENTPGTHGVDGYHIYFAVRVDDATVPLDGFSLRLTVPIKSTKGAVTAVPLSAITLAADGSSRVQVESNGKLNYVVVHPGLVADGYVEVTSRDELLKTGQLVVVGHTSPEKAPVQPQ
jgi:peptidoglycan hydrolase-like protein with peptidoglycan-binding domain